MKKILYVILGIAFLYFVLAFFGPSEIKVEREITINQSATFVREKMGDFKFFHDSWSPWTEKDPAMVCTYKGNSGELGHTYTWSGNKEVGSGEMEINGVTPDSILIRLNFGGKGDSKTYYIIKEENNATKVIWGMVMEIGFIGRTPMLFINMDKMLGGDFEKGLSRLKSALESMDDLANPTFEIIESNWEAVSYIGRKETVALDKLNEYFENNFGLLDMILEKNNIKPASPPSGLYFSYDEVNQKTEVCTAYKVPSGTKIKDWDTYNFPAAKVVSVTYKGDPSKTGAAHNAIATYLKEKGFDYQMVIEEYVDSPEKGKDPSNCITNVYYLLK